MENNIGKESIIYKFYLLLNFIVYLLFMNVFRIKLKILKIKNKKAADRYAYKLARNISNYAIKLTKTKMKVIGEENIPEGTRSRSYKVGDFKKGSFKLALKANATIVPVSINGTYKVMENGDRVTGNKVSIIFHQPIFVDKLSKEEKKDLSERVRVIICNGVNQLLANE